MNDIAATLRESIFLPGSVTESCHASTVLPLSDGRVAAAWFGGSAEGKDDVKIYVSVREKSGWQKPVCVHVAGSEEPHWNPALFLRLDGSVCLYFKFGKLIPEWRTFAAISTDGCKSFSEPFELVPGDRSGGRGPVKNKPIRLSDGMVLAPASKETKLSWRCFIDRSDDDGRTFTRSGFVLRPKKGGRPVGMIQPTLWEDESGVHLLARSNAGALYRSDSRDQGEHWCKAYETSLPNPNSGVDLVRTEDGSIFLVSNPIRENWGNRAPLLLSRSDDNGKTFYEVLKLEAQTGDHEFSYPAIAADGEVLHITYTCERKTIVYQRVELN